MNFLRKKVLLDQEEQMEDAKSGRDQEEAEEEEHEDNTEYQDEGIVLED